MTLTKKRRLELKKTRKQMAKEGAPRVVNVLSLVEPAELLGLL